MMPSSPERSNSGSATTTARSGSHHRRHRSRRSGRRRRRHRNHSHRFGLKQAERNWIAAVFDMVVMAVLISSLADQSWFRLHGGKCPTKAVGVLNFLFGNFPPDEQACFDTKITAIMRSIVAMVFLSIGTTLFAFALDTLGPSRKLLKAMRRHGIGNIFAVFICVITCGLSYWAALLLEEMLRADPISPESSRTFVLFDTGYFLMVMAGALSVLISATNLLWPHPLFERQRHERLVDDWEEFLEQDMTGVPPTFNVSTPPPEYTP